MPLGIKQAIKMSEMGQVGPQASGAHTPFEGDSQFLLLSENEGPVCLVLPISQEMSEIWVFYVNSPDFLKRFFLDFYFTVF